MKSRQVTNDSSNERKNKELVNMKPIKIIKEKTVKMDKSEFHRLRKKNTSDSEKANVKKSKDHMHNNKKLESQNEENNIVPKYGLKRKRSRNNGMQDNKDITVDLRLSKLQKRRKVDITEENTDTLNLNDLSREHILQCIRAIFHLTEEQLESKNALFEGESHPVFMQVTCIRVPKTPRRQMRILLQHSIVSSNDEVALFVGDLQRGRRKDYEPTIEHYEELLRKHGCTSIKAILPLNQVKTEYDQYELKRKLVASYDHFLVDGKIAGHLSHLLGKQFYKKRKLPTSIRMQSKDLKHEIEYALKKTTMQLHSCGDTHIVQIGHTSMTNEELLENVLTTCKYLSKNYPGGWANIRSIRIKTPSSLALPIYTTLKSKNSVKTPMVHPKRPKAYHAVTGELSTISGNTMVTVTPEGFVNIEKKRMRIRRQKME
ncbi:ribosomal L1 domain-containing protein CG13096-like [Hylaeus volcanicus]|uniref:ribosomal L1 domain-containing protein CG13096-like n=1 Tax=Hylaeus volcanicus TaxID=313075 RepID=UPI0023B773DF|nr:ribosomal L1 domain-containing protein CG13096-like [Hylaeus volcanicus]